MGGGGSLVVVYAGLLLWASSGVCDCAVIAGDGMQAVGCMECMGHFVAFNKETQERLDEKTCCEVLSSANIPQVGTATLSTRTPSAC